MYSFTTLSRAKFAVEINEHVVMTMVAIGGNVHPDPHSQNITFDEPPTVGQMFFFYHEDEKTPGGRKKRGHTSEVVSIQVDHPTLGERETTTPGDTLAMLLARLDDLTPYDDHDDDDEPPTPTVMPIPVADPVAPAPTGNVVVFPFGGTPLHVLSASTYPMAV